LTENGQSFIAARLWPSFYPECDETMTDITQALSELTALPIHAGAFLATKCMWPEKFPERAAAISAT
jgi:hypothetical protein